MEHIKCYLLLGYHPIYENLAKYPPKGIEYNIKPSQTEYDTLKVYRRTHMIKRSLVTKLFNLFKLPRVFYVTKECDLIHSTRGFLILNRKPWVVDVERAASFVWLQDDKLKQKVYRQKVEKLLSSKYCKKILPHSIASQKSIYSAFDTSKFKEKLEVVYPAIPPTDKKTKKSEKLRILFVGKSFFGKGGKELLQAFDVLDKKYDIELLMKCENVPEEWKRKYEEKDNVIFFDKIVSRKELFEEIYLKSDIFVLPTYIDTFGYVFLEAMSAGLPLVGTDIFAVPEIIEDGKNGFLIHSPVSWFGPDFLVRPIEHDLAKTNFPEVVSRLVKKISLLIEDSSLRKRMGRYGRRLVEKGKFSIKERNKKLRKIYEEALRY